VSTETEISERQTIPPEDYGQVIAETANSNLPKVSRATNWLFKKEVLILLFGEDYQGWFQGLRQVFTILAVPILFLVVITWLVFVGYFLWRAAFYRYDFNLSDNVLIAMITSTTATVIGLFHYANRWLFEIRAEDLLKPKTD